VVVSNEVVTALDEGRGVVALETTIVVHGLPAPVNLEVAASCEQAVRESGAVPATIGVLDGVIVVGLSAVELERLASPLLDATKLSARDIALAVALRVDGATTVAATIVCAYLVGISVMATGGLGGVHRDAHVTFDDALAHSGVGGRVGGQVDPGHRRDARATRHAGCAGRRLPDHEVSRFLPQ
jgi:pseudouridine-5'-phosphate glycosidase